MPLVRYLIDDRVVAVPGPCRCGSSFRRIRLLDGRIEDAVVLPGGRRVYFGAFWLAAATVPGVAELAVRQDEQGAITVSTVLDRDGGRSFEEVAAGVRACLRDQLDLALPMDVVQVDRIELTPGGKARLVTSAYRPAGEVRS